ncbi:MAG TPA: hypothetical protein VJN67_22805 [Stellaceae bacterium]|nr:hypothetical protein [Stellaceae bacterium]
MNGPNPVWTFAMKKLSQSSPARLLADGAGVTSTTVPLAALGSR